VKTVSAADARRRLGALLDAAAAGESVLIARAGSPVAALVPFGERREDRDARIARQLAALEDLGRDPLQLAPGTDVVEMIREQRRQRTEQIVSAALEARGITGGLATSNDPETDEHGTRDADARGEV
jgi:prevent-host-death family protein